MFCMRNFMVVSVVVRGFAAKARTIRLWFRLSSYLSLRTEGITVPGSIVAMGRRSRTTTRGMTGPVP